MLKLIINMLSYIKGNFYSIFKECRLINFFFFHFCSNVLFQNNFFWIKLHKGACNFVIGVLVLYFYSIRSVNVECYSSNYLSLKCIEPFIISLVFSLCSSEIQCHHIYNLGHVFLFLFCSDSVQNLSVLSTMNLLIDRI